MKNLPIFSHWHSSVGPCLSWPIRLCLDRRAGLKEEIREGSYKIEKISFCHLGVSKNSGTPKSFILIGFSIINHPFWGTPIFGNTYFLHIENA